MPDYNSNQQLSDDFAKIDFIVSMQNIMRLIHDSAVSKGHWDSPVDITKSLCWIHSEVSEAFDAWQHGSKPSTKIPYSTLVEELADVFIVMADMCQANGFDLAKAIIDKIDFNKTREYRHGKVN